MGRLRGDEEGFRSLAYRAHCEPEAAGTYCWTSICLVAMTGRSSWSVIETLWRGSPDQMLHCRMSYSRMMGQEKELTRRRALAWWANKAAARSAL